MFDVSSFSPAADRPMVAGTFGSQGSASVIVEPQSLSSGLQDFWQFYFPEMLLLCGKKKKTKKKWQPFFRTQEEKTRLLTELFLILPSFTYKGEFNLHVL